jgi:hypothetical protein
MPRDLEPRSPSIPPSRNFPSPRDDDGASQETKSAWKSAAAPSQHGRGAEAVDPKTRWEGEGGAPATGPTGRATDQVRSRAHALYEERRREGKPGDALTDWLRAERENSTEVPATPGLEARRAENRAEGPPD